MECRIAHKFIINWLPIIIYCSIIFYLSSGPSPEVIPDYPYIDKLLHIIEYSILGLLFMRAAYNYEFGSQKKLLFLSILFTTLYGISDELHQYFVPYRFSDIMDIAADLVGATIGSLTYIWVRL
jgi:VanZ family protein